MRREVFEQYGTLMCMKEKVYKTQEFSDPAKETVRIICALVKHATNAWASTPAQGRTWGT